MTTITFRAAPVLMLVGFICALVCLLVGVTTPALLLPAAALTGGLALLPKLTADSELRAWYPLPLTLFLASGLAVLVLYLYAPSFPPFAWLAPSLAFVGAAATEWFGLIGRKRCELCNRRVGTNVSFACPRCGLFVCDDSCWQFEQLRCRLCSQNAVPVFSADSRWWDRAIGPRFHGGQCQLCLTSGANTDLRACRRCGRPQCRSCWDDRNGRCSRCGWMIDDLPPQLATYVTTADARAALD